MTRELTLWSEVGDVEDVGNGEESYLEDELPHCSCPVACRRGEQRKRYKPDNPLGVYGCGKCGEECRNGDKAAAYKPFAVAPSDVEKECGKDGVESQEYVIAFTHPALLSLRLTSR